MGRLDSGRDGDGGAGDEAKCSDEEIWRKFGVLVWGRLSEVNVWSW